jgi:hypothetical protein
VSGVEKGDIRYLYETTPKWHVFLVIRLAAAMAWIKQRTAEYRITKNEFRRMESLCSISFLKKIEYIFNRKDRTKPPARRGCCAYALASGP